MVDSDPNPKYLSVYCLVAVVYCLVIVLYYIVTGVYDPHGGVGAYVVGSKKGCFYFAYTREWAR